jgi:hypothetical protein
MFGLTLPAWVFKVGVLLIEHKLGSKEDCWLAFLPSRSLLVKAHPHILYLLLYLGIAVEGDGEMELMPTSAKSLIVLICSFPFSWYRYRTVYYKNLAFYPTTQS